MEGIVVEGWRNLIRSLSSIALLLSIPGCDLIRNEDQQRPIYERSLGEFGRSDFCERVRQSVVETSSSFERFKCSSVGNVHQIADFHLEGLTIVVAESGKPDVFSLLAYGSKVDASKNEKLLLDKLASQISK